MKTAKAPKREQGLKKIADDLARIEAECDISIERIEFMANLPKIIKEMQDEIKRLSELIEGKA